MNTTTRPRAARRAIGAIGAALASALMMIPCTTAIAAETGVPIDAAHFPDKKFRSIVHRYDTNNNGALSQQELTEVTTISDRGYDYIEYDIKSAKGIEYFTALTFLELGYNQLSSVDLSHNTKLTELELSNNQLSSVDLSHNTKLNRLNLSNNQLSSVDLSHNTELEWLFLDGNQLSSVDVSHNTKLDWLNLSNNQLSSVDLSHNTALEDLELDGNQLSSVDVSHNTKLNWLNLSNNQLSSVDVSHNTSLTYLWLYDNQLSSVDLSHNTALRGLDLSNNQLSSLDVSHNTALEGLGLNGNRLLWVDGVENSIYENFINPALYDQREFGPVAASSLDLAKAAPGIDVSRISNVQGGELQGTVLTPTNDSGLVTYDYRFSDEYKPLNAQVRFITFRDVSGSTSHAEDIQWLVDNGISTGWKEADGSFTFRGMSPVVRQDMAAFLRREAKNRNIADARTWQPSAADWKRFKDVDRSTPHAEDVLWLAHAGISTGWKEADGTFTFGGTIPVYRQDMAAFLKRLADKAGKSGGVTPKAFRDVNSSTPHAAEIRWLGGSGISTGFPDGTFRGGEQVIRQDMAAFIHRLDTYLTK